MNSLDYQSFADAWESRASIRTRPRRLVEDDQRLISPLTPAKPPLKVAGT